MKLLRRAQGERERGEKVKAGGNGRLELDGIIIIKLYNELIIKLIYAVR